MIRKSNGELFAECEDCGEQFFGGTLEWDDFIADLRVNGWQIKLVDGTWEHYCPECKE